MNISPSKFGSLLVAACLTAASLPAATFYVDPVNGSMSGDGSQSNPWSTLEAVFTNNLIETQKPQSKPYDGTGPLVPKNAGAPVKAGDTLILLSGSHGTIDTNWYYNADMITIEAAPGATPVLDKWHMESAKNWTLRGLTISPEPYGTLTGGTLVGFSEHSKLGPMSDCVVEDCEVYTVDDSSAWTAQDWIDNARTGIAVSGSNMVVRNNLVRNVDHGISAGADYVVVQYNQIINFSGDGMRGNGNYGLFEYNFVMNNYNVDGNHDDGFQSWSKPENGNVVIGHVLRGNVFIQTDDLNRPLNGPMQGISCFDGWYQDWVIENNLTVTNETNAIALAGGINCRIANNTCVQLSDEHWRPRVWLSELKNGTPGYGNVVVNNIAANIVKTNTNVGGVMSNNIELAWQDYDTYFVDHANLDCRLVAGSPAIDAGTASGAATIDIMGISRPQGAGIDLGAYEYASEVLPIEGLPADRQVNDNGSMPFVGQTSGRIGGSTTSIESAMVYVFQLPVLDAGETILNANLDFSLINIANGTFAGEVDLYALPYRSSNTVSAVTDFYHGIYNGDANATAIQQGIMSNVQPAGRISSDATADWNLTAFLAAQYAAGAQGGDYIFLRLNSSETNHTDFRYWQVATANDVVQNRPVLTVEIGQ